MKTPLLSVQTRILIAFVSLTLISIAVVTWQGYRSARAALTDAAERELVGLQRAKSEQVGTILATTRRQVVALSGVPLFVEAARDLRSRLPGGLRQPGHPGDEGGGGAVLPAGLRPRARQTIGHRPAGGELHSPQCRGAVSAVPLRRAGRRRLRRVRRPRLQDRRRPVRRRARPPFPRSCAAHSTGWTSTASPWSIRRRWRSSTATGRAPCSGRASGMAPTPRAISRRWCGRSGRPRTSTTTG